MVGVVEGLVVGVVVGVVMMVAGYAMAGVSARRASKAAAWENGYGAEKGKAAAIEHLTRQDRERRTQEDQAAATKKAAAARVAAQAHAGRIAALEQERIGARFVEHPGPNESDVLLTVESLDRQSPLDRVLVSRVSTGGTAPPDGLERLSVRWSTLTEPAPVQRHRNARVVKGSLDDAEGWSTYKRVKPAEASHRTGGGSNASA